MKAMKLGPFICALVGMTSLIGCGGASDGTSTLPLTENDGGPDAVNTAPEAAGLDAASQPDAATPQTDAAVTESDAASADGGDCLADDQPDDQGKDTNCDGVDGVATRDVYVDGTVGLDSNGGTPDKPVRSIATALTRARDNGGSVLLAAGSYAIDTIDQAGTWAIYGGYPAKFVGDPKRELTVLTVSASGLLVKGPAGATIAHVSIQGADATDKTQRTAHGLRLSGGNLALLDVVVQSGSALDGDNAASGATGMQGKKGDDGGDLYPGHGASGLTCNGQAEPSYTQGAYGGDASQEGKEPGSGLIGSAGTDGTPGVNAVTDPIVQGGYVAWADGKPGNDDGSPGYGGAGGKQPSSYVTWQGNAYTIKPGGGGTGGCPGRGGAGGQSGGGSVAITVLDGVLTLKGALLKTGSAGAGGDGGPGGSGGLGGAGGLPGSSSLDSGSPPIAFPASCMVLSDPILLGCTAYGLSGGPGGRGGLGGAGAGGSTIGVLTIGPATATVDPGTTYQLGQIGLGGTGGSGRGPTGKKSPTVHVAVAHP